MKIKISTDNYGTSSKLVVELTSEKNPLVKCTLSSYYWADLENAKKLVKELEEEGDSTDVRSTN